MGSCPDGIWIIRIIEYPIPAMDLGFKGKNYIFISLKFGCFTTCDRHVHYGRLSSEVSLADTVHNTKNMCACVSPKKVRQVRSVGQYFSRKSVTNSMKACKSDYDTYILISAKYGLCIILYDRLLNSNKCLGSLVNWFVNCYIWVTKRSIKASNKNPIPIIHAESRMMINRIPSRPPLKVH